MNMLEGASLRGTLVRAHVRPYDEKHDRNARYYFEGLRRVMAAVGGRYEEVSMCRRPELLGVMRDVRRAYRLRPLYQRAEWLPATLDRVARRIEGPIHTPSGLFHDDSAQCTVTFPGGREVKVCVQSDDTGTRFDPGILAWSDLCFKTNYWPSLAYPTKVVPSVNADPLVIPQIRTFRSHRALPKAHDVCMVVRVWGGQDEIEGVEHNLRLIEAVSRARCSKFLYAYLVAGDVEASRRRLERQGIPCGVHPLPSDDLWRASAAARLNVVRLGMHYCIPWRVTGALAIGSALVLDRAPFTRWPEPLTEDVHYVSLGTETSVDQPLATDAQYAAIPEKIEAWLAQPDLAARIGRNNADYYDRFAAPERVGEHTVRTAARHAGLLPSRSVAPAASARG